VDNADVNSNSIINRLKYKLSFRVSSLELNQQSEVLRQNNEYKNNIFIETCSFIQQTHSCTVKHSFLQSFTLLSQLDQQSVA